MKPFFYKIVKTSALTSSYALHLGEAAEGETGECTSQGFSGRGTARAEDAQAAPTQSHISPSILVYEDKTGPEQVERLDLGCRGAWQLHPRHSLPFSEGQNIVLP